MSWFNYAGLVIVAIIMMPNIIYAIKKTDGFDNAYKNKTAIICEQVGRYGCIAFMIFNIPYASFNFWFNGALIAYIAVNAALCSAYIICWVVLWNKSGKVRALFLSILPSCVFVFSGVMLVNIPLLVCSLIFAPSHILISCKNAKILSCNKKSEDF